MPVIPTGRPKSALKNYWHTWVDTRSPSAPRHRLHHKNLFVLPTATGWAFVLLALIIWLLGTNYQNNLILALSYFQLSLLVIVILHTYNNLSGLTIECLGSDGGHAGQKIDFKFRVTSANTFGCHNVKITWPGGSPDIYDISAGEAQWIVVGIKVDQRGRFRPGRLLLHSDFPMGLVQCWTWLRFNTEVIVYPQVLECELPAAAGTEGQESDTADANIGGEEFLGYRQYRAGDAIRHIAWKQYARERGLYSKLYGGSRAKAEQLSWQQFYQKDVEQALSRMTYWALELYKQNAGFSLLLPSAEVPLDDGEAHLAQALNALALHGQK